MFFVLDGEAFIEYESHKVENLKKNDVFIIEPNINHKTSAKKAKLLLVCNPPFNINNVIFKD